MESAFPRYTVSKSAGARENKQFVVWDRYTHSAASFHQTFKQAQKEVWRMNGKAK